MEWLTALLAIIAIDIVLAGDNAVVIAMATRSLPSDQKKKAIMWGTVGAVVVRVVLTFVATMLLDIPLLMAVGGLLLLHVAVKLLVGEEDAEDAKVISGTYQAIKTIVVADIVMGLDNVLAVAGASHGSFLLILIGLAVSIPLVVWGSQIISNYMNKYPVLVYVGAGIIAYTAIKMFFHDKIVGNFVAEKLGNSTSLVTIIVEILVVIAVLLIGKRKSNKKKSEQAVA